jgi:Leucine-rich repeat (LRR) protein
LAWESQRIIIIKNLNWEKAHFMRRDMDYQKAEQKIKEAVSSGVKELDLSVSSDNDNATGLTELPESIGQLTQLEKLNIKNNQLIKLPESLGQLTLLQSLNCSKNQLTKLPESICQLTQLQELDLSYNRLTTLPESLGKLTLLQSLNLCKNQLRTFPEELCQLTQLQDLDVAYNQLTTLPKSLGKFSQLQLLNIAQNQLTTLPESLGQLCCLCELRIYGNSITALPDSIAMLLKLEILYMDNPFGKLPESIKHLSNLRELGIGECGLSFIPEWIGELRQLSWLNLLGNKLSDLPESITQLQHLERLDLKGNPLNPELAAAYKEGLDTVKSYLRANAEAKVVLNEAKLILIGEGEVGKSCLLGALRGDPWEETRPTTHGIEIKPVKVTDPDTGTEITLNGWDFGGQPVYRPTHQLFFSAPAVYLVVWKPREGPQAGAVKEWIKLVKHREPEAKILVVATHGGPRERKPDINRQEIWEMFGQETVINFFHVESKPAKYDKKNKKWTGKRKGIMELKNAIAKLAASLLEVGRSVPKRWQDVREALLQTGEPYLPIERVIALCCNEKHKMSENEAQDFISVSHRLGHFIHYGHDPRLKDMVILKPDWLATAVSFVLDDEETRKKHGLVKFARLGKLWSDKTRDKEFRYPTKVHLMFVALMERFDLSYRVAGSPFGGPTDDTSLIAQLVPDVRPEVDIAREWPEQLQSGDEQQVQICRILDDKRQSATAEGLFYQLIVRLHKFSLGRENFNASVHWQRGLILDDDYNGRALLEYIGNDIRITVRAPYPINLLAILTREVKWLVEHFWEGLRCDVMVPCVEPCGRKAPGTGLFEVEKLIESKKRNRHEYPCPLCNEWQNINSLLRNAPAARRDPVTELLDDFQFIKDALEDIKPLLQTQHNVMLRRFDTHEARILSRLDNAYTGLMRAFADDAKEGPRLFSIEPVENSKFNPNGWVKKKFRVMLWCEHTRLPLV